ncbi:MAG: GTPase HflX [Thermoplasmata archaeon]|nr:MAG: GTPase HflX [Thermoplasmata archaeon]
MLLEYKQSIVVSLNDDVTEIIQLAKSFEYDVVNTFIQHRNNPNVKTYIGSGKLDEIKSYLEDNEEIGLIIFDGELRPSQWFLLEKELGVTVYDRIKLILMIFKERAKIKEAQLQVQLAELEYEKPHVKELIHRTRSGEHPGLMAGGEYQVDDYFEMIKKQIKLIKNKLLKIEQDRAVLRKHRKRSGFYLVSLAGYTNAGKSSLLNVLTNEDVTVKNQLFSTLSTTTRKINDDKLPILLTDTVGFIQNLPTWIIKAFHSTLEEIKEADLVLLVIDVSDPFPIVLKKINASLKELGELNFSSSMLLILNKIDLLRKENISDIKNQICELVHFSKDDIIEVSLKEKIGIYGLINGIMTHLPDMLHMELELPQSSEIQSFISFLYDKTYVLSTSYEKNIYVELKCNANLLSKIKSFCIEFNGTIL